MTTLARNRQRWTRVEDTKLIELYNENKNYYDIALELGRTEDAVKARFVKLEIVKNYYEDRPFKNQSKKICRKYNINQDDLMRYLKYTGLIINEDSEESENSDEMEDSEESEVSDSSEESEESEDSDSLEVSEESNSITDIVYNLKIISKKISIIGTAFILYSGYRIITHILSKY